MPSTSFTTIAVAATTLHLSPPEGEPPACVAYRATKSVAFGAEIDVVGRSCEVSLAVRSTGPKHVVLEATIPVRSFGSGDRARDRHVADLFDGRDVRFVSRPLSKGDITRLSTTESPSWSGQLTLGGVTRELHVAFHRVGPVLEGRAQARLSEFGRDAPRVGPFGFGGRVQDELSFTVELRVEWVRERILRSAGWALSMPSMPTRGAS